MQQINGVPVVHIYVCPLHIPVYIEVDIDEYARIIVYHVPRLDCIAMENFDMTR